MLPGTAVTDFPRRASENHSYLYVLIDPRTEDVRYAGKAKSAVSRAQGHWFDRNDPSAPNEGKKAWLRELDAVALRPIVRIIAVVHRAEWKAREQALIGSCVTRGTPC